MNFVLTTWSNNFCVWKELGDVSHRYLFKTKYFKKQYRYSECRDRLMFQNALQFTYLLFCFMIYGRANERVGGGGGALF